MYDIVVVGSDLSSLVAACLAVHRGKRTLLLRESDPAAGFSLPGGYRFDLDPLPWSGMDESGVLLKFLRDMRVDCPPPDPDSSLLQIFLENRSIGLPAGNIERYRTMSRDYRVGMNDLDRFFRAISETEQYLRESISRNLGLAENREEQASRFLRDAAARILTGFRSLRTPSFPGHVPELKRTLEAEYTLFCRCRRGPFTLLNSSYCLASSLKGAFRLPPGGKETVLTALAATITRNGGSILQCDRAAIIRANGPVVLEIEKDGLSERLETAACIASTRWAGLGAFAQHDPLLSPWYASIASPRDVLYPLTLHLGVLASSLPEGMGSHMLLLLQEPEKPFPMLPVMYVASSPRPGAGDLLPSEGCSLALTVLLTASPHRLPADIPSQIADAMFQVFRWYVPFLPEGLESIDIDRSIKVSCQEAAVLERTAGTGRPPRVRFPFHGADTPRENLYVTGGSLLPMLGFDSEVLSGINAVRTVLGERNYPYYPYDRDR